MARRSAADRMVIPSIICSVRPISGLCSHLKRDAPDDTHDDRRPAIVGGCRFAPDIPDRGPVVELEPSAQRVGQELLNHCPDELLAALEEQQPQPLRTLKGGAAEERCRGVDRGTTVCSPPLADRIEVLEGEAER